MDAVIPVIMGAWVVFALWLARDGWRHARWSPRSDGGHHESHSAHRQAPGDETTSRAHGLLLAATRFAAALGLLAVVAGTVYGADLLWLALGPPVVILVAGLAAHVGTQWLVHRSDDGTRSLWEGS